MNIQQLLERYDLKTRQSIYSWCKTLGIELSKDDSGKVKATPEEIDRLDKLKEHLSIPGNTLSNFIPISEVYVERGYDLVNVPILERESPSEIAILLGDILNILKSQMARSEVLWHNQELQKACDRGWLIKTSELKQIIGASPSIKKGEKVYQRGNWIFTKQGRIGRETAWKVSQSRKAGTGIYEV